MENLLLLTDNSELDLDAYRDLGVHLFTEATIKPSDYASITIMFGWKPDISKKVLAATGSSLKWLQTFSAGVDYLPLDQLKANHILVSNMSGVHAIPISQTILLYALYFARDLPRVLADSKQKHWTDQHNFGEVVTLDDLSWTIFGTGHIGSELARLLQSFHAKVIGVNRTGHSAANFDETYAQSDWRKAVADTDVIVNIMPLTKETAHFYDKTFFDFLKSAFLFVNVGRGGSVDTSALIEALHSDHLQHAALDVFEQEPLPSNSSLWQMPNVLITPHYSAQMSHLGRAWDKILLPNLKQFMTDGTVATNRVNIKNGY